MQTYVITQNQLKHLEDIGKTKQIVVIFAKWKQAIYSKLENFHKPQDSALIGFFAEQQNKKMMEGFETHFDELFWYQADYTGFEDLYSDLKEFPMPELDLFLSQLVKVIPKEKLRIIESEEVLMTTLCTLRKKYEIQGPSYDDLEHLRNKALIKKIAYKEGIPTAPFAIVDFSRDLDVDNEVIRIESRIDKYPMFAKPVHGVGCGGSYTLKNEFQLMSWLDHMKNTNKNATYLIEEFVYGLEFNAAVCLLSDGSWKSLQLTTFPERGKERILKNSEPYLILGGRFEEMEESFPNIDKFVDRVIKVYKPPHPHLFTVQGFQLQKNTDNYYLVEMSYRPQGQRGTMLSYPYCGVGQETALLSCHLDPDYKAEPDPNKPKIFERHMWFPYKEGLLKSHRGIDKDSPILSEVEFNWLVDPGTKLCKPQSFAHFLVALSVKHQDKNQVLADLKWIEENWLPDIEPL